MKKLAMTQIIGLLVFCCVINAFAGVAREPKKTGGGGTNNIMAARAGALQQVVTKNVTSSGKSDIDKENSESCFTKNGCVAVIKIVDNNIEYSFIDIDLIDGTQNKKN